MSVNILGKKYQIATTTKLYLSYYKLTEIREDKKLCFLYTCRTRINRKPILI